MLNWDRGEALKGRKRRVYVTKSFGCELSRAGLLSAKLSAFLRDGPRRSSRRSSWVEQRWNQLRPL